MYDPICVLIYIYRTITYYNYIYIVYMYAHTHTETHPPHTEYIYIYTRILECTSPVWSRVWMCKSFSWDLLYRTLAGLQLTERRNCQEYWQMSAMMVKQHESRTNSGDRYPTLVIAKVDWGCGWIMLNPCRVHQLMDCPLAETLNAVLPSLYMLDTHMTWVLQPAARQDKIFMQVRFGENWWVSQLDFLPRWT